MINIKKLNKINHFRRYSKGYTGQKKFAYRDYTFNENDFSNIRNIINQLKANNFSGFDPLLITQLIRGKLFTYLDIFMTNSSKENDYVKSVVDLIYDFLDFSIQFFVYFKDNLHLVDLYDKNTDLSLIDEKIAVIACYHEIILCLKRIFGRDERINSFYKVCFYM